MSDTPPEVRLNLGLAHEGGDSLSGSLDRCAAPHQVQPNPFTDQSTMSLATDMLAAYQKAERDVLQGRSISFNGRTVTFEDLAEIRKGRAEWERRAASENGRPGGLGFSLATLSGR